MIKGLDLWTIERDGSNATNLTDDIPGDTIYPSWAPDGTRLAFSCTGSGNFDICTINADGSQFRNLTAPPQ